MAQNLPPNSRNAHFTNGLGSAILPRPDTAAIMLNRLVFSLVTLLLAANSFGQEPVFINEFMANNATSITDENGDHVDWIELRNASDADVDLAGYYLVSKTKRWKFPATNIVANGYLIVYASGKDRTTPRLHTNFSLDTDGEYLAFVKPDGVTIASEFSPAYPKQYKDYSYGWDTTGTNLVYFSKGTPGAANTDGVIAFAKDTQFSQDRGFYDTPFDLAIITATEGATIRYTTNGTVPTLTGTNSFTYTNGVGIHIAGTTVIRASAFKTGFQPSSPDTQTYIFLNDVIHQAPDGKAPPGWPSSWGGNSVDYGMDPDIVNSPNYKDTIVNDLKTIPSISIVMSLDDLFNATTGIYSHPDQDGSGWERPCSVEFIRTDGVQGFHVNAGIRIRGGFSRSTSNPKHAFRLFFREEYGDSKLRYPLFGDNGTDEFDKLDIRTFQNYSWSFQGDSRGVFIRDVFSRDAQLAMGQQGERGDYCHLYINGIYWGLYNTDERPEANFGATYWGGDRNNFDTIKVEAGPYTINATDGDLNAWTQLYNLAVPGLSTDAAYFKVQGRNPDGSRNPAYPNLVDVTNMIDYMLVILYGGNLDAPISNFLNNDRPNNWYGIRDRTGDAGFRFISHDAEHTLLDATADRTGPFVAGQNGLVYSNPQYIWQQMWGNNEFKMLVADRAQKHLLGNGALTETNAATRFRYRMSQIDRAVVGESARWGDAKVATPYTRDTWLAACNQILNNFFHTQINGVTKTRGEIVIGQLKTQGLFPDIDAPTFSQQGGNVPAGYSLTLSAPGSTIYYTLDGSDPRLIGGAVSPAAKSYSGAILINDSLTVRARAQAAGGVWSAVNEADFYVIRNFTNLLITEIMYHPVTPAGIDANSMEFIELKNASSSEMDLSGVRFTNGIAYAFPIGKKLSPGNFAVLVRDAAAFQSLYPGVAIDGVYTNKLDDGGETLALVHASGAPIVSVHYSDTAPWPLSADGAGFSLVPRDPNFNPDPNNAANWRASAHPGGSPGQDDPPLNVLPILINEALTHTDLPTVDAIELYNPNEEPVDIGGWFLTDDRLTPNKFQIPSPTVIDANGYIVFTEADFNPTPGVGTSFSLSSQGDELYLYSADPTGNLTGYSDGFSFGGAENSVTFGRYTNSVGEVLFPPQIQNTLGAVNSGPRVGPVVINEIRYFPKPGDEEFVELRNLTASAIKLYHVDHPTNHWKINGIDFSFPDGAEIPANGYLVVASVDPVLFRSHNSIPASVQVFGPFNGALQDNGELLELQRPDSPDQNADGTFTVPFITVDAVRYDNKSPWPIAAAGTGSSLERIDSAAFGNDPINWRASSGPASPGLDNNGNRPPQVSAGPDGAATAETFPVDVPLSPTITDDGLPAPAQLTYSWTQVSGPGVVLFANPNAASTTAGLPGVGHYILRLTVSDGELSSSDDIEFQVDRPLSAVTFVSKGSVWRYLDDNSNQGTAWRDPAFDDSAWNSGPAQLGFGDGDEVTVINGGPSNARYITTYFRGTFDVPSVAGLRDLAVNVLRDDGVVVYLNGTEVFRSNMPEGATITSSTYASSAVGGADETTTYYPGAISPTLLKAGANTLAIELHQANATSSDLSFDLELTGNVSSQNTAPIVNAGPDLSITLPAQVDLQGSVIDDGLPLPPGAPSNLWTVVSGPAAVTFDNPAAPRTAARFSTAGTYVLRLTSNDGEFTIQDEMTVSVAPGDAYAAWKSANFTAAELSDPNISGDNADPDGDGMANLAEYIAGTNPRDAQSFLSVGAITTDTGIGLIFDAMPGRSYDIVTREAVDSGIWSIVQSVQPTQTEQPIQINLGTLLDEPTRFYKISIGTP
jgi:hypothetical protein